MKKLIKSLLLLFIFILLISLPISAAQVHRVKPGEDLFSIAQSYHVTIPEIVNLNHLINPGNIYVSQVLIIPASKTPSTYRVKKGDTLYKIAKKHNISLQKLATANHISLVDPLYERQLLYIPPRPKIYLVKKGDTLTKIADKYNINLNNLLSRNNLSENEAIYPGDKLTIPRPENNKPKYKGPNYKKLYPETFFRRGITQNYKIALTFDDGPDGLYTPQILNVLKKYNVPATFFVIGNRVKENPEVIKRIITDGHILANHSWSHANLSQGDKQLIDHQIEATENILKNNTGLKTAYLRPPYGAVSKSLLDKSRNKGYKIIHWSIDSVDWYARDVDQILINTLPNIHKDAILLFHSAGGTGHDLSATVKVLPELIKTLRMIGYQFVNLNELINCKPYKS